MSCKWLSWPQLPPGSVSQFTHSIVCLYRTPRTSLYKRIVLHLLLEGKCKLELDWAVRKVFQLDSLEPAFCRSNCRRLKSSECLSTHIIFTAFMCSSHSAKNTANPKQLVLRLRKNKTTELARY